MSYTENKQGIPVIQMRPGASLDYPMDWTDWLDGQGIASYKVTAPPGLTKTTVMLDGGVVVAWLKAGPGNYQHQVRFDIVTDSSPPREDSRTIILDVRP